MRKISFVIPCYNSSNTIGEVIAEIKNVIRAEDDYEIICINDYSPDNVSEVLHKLASEDSRIKVLDFSRNFGQHNALMAGYRQATGHLIVSLDDDGQTPAQECYRLIDTLCDEEFDVVYAQYEKKKHGWFRNLGSAVTSVMNRRIIGAPKGLYASSFFVCKSFIIDEVIKYEGSYTFISGLIFRSTKNIGNADINHRNRFSGDSGYSIKKLFSLWLNGMTSFSVKPLRFASVFGFIVAALGFLYGMYIIVRKLMMPEIEAGYSSMMASLFFLGGMMMVTLGLLGEYVGRIYMSLNKSPQYVIKNSANIENGLIDE